MQLELTEIHRGHRPFPFHHIVILKDIKQLYRRFNVDLRPIDSFRQLFTQLFPVNVEYYKLRWSYPAAAKALCSAQPLVVQLTRKKHFR